jgi:hypothetical protein
MAKIRLFPQASWTLINGSRLPFIDSHKLYPSGTVAQVTALTGEKTFVKLLSPYSKTPYGYLYDYEPVKKLRFYDIPPVDVGEKLWYNHVPYEVLSVTFVPTAYFDDNSYRPAHYILEAIEI